MFNFEEKSFELYSDNFDMSYDNYIEHWFSLTEVHPFTYEGEEYNTALHCYLSHQLLLRQQNQMFLKQPPLKALKIFKSLWHKRMNMSDKAVLLYNIILEQYKQNRTLHDLLLTTDDKDTINWVNYNDTFLGVCIFTCKGMNILGQILEKIRFDVLHDLPF